MNPVGDTNRDSGHVCVCVREMTSTVGPHSSVLTTAFTSLDLKLIIFERDLEAIPAATG